MKILYILAAMALLASSISACGNSERPFTSEELRETSRFYTMTQEMVREKFGDDLQFPPMPTSGEVTEHKSGEAMFESDSLTIWTGPDMVTVEGHYRRADNEHGRFTAELVRKGSSWKPVSEGDEGIWLTPAM